MKADALRATPTEAQFQRQVIDLARLHGWRVHAERPARTAKGWRTPIMGDAGFPDLVLVRRGVILFVELKTDKGRATPDQVAWLDDLRETDAAAGVWRPSDWSVIEKTLAH